MIARPPIARTVALLLTCATGAGLVLLGRAGARLAPASAVSAAPRAIDGEAPDDARYQHALRAGLARKYDGAYREFLALSRAERGTNLGAWSLYEAALTAEARKDRSAEETLLAELRRDYPQHHLTLTRAARTKTTKPRERLTDCGPRSLQFLCEKAGFAASLEAVARDCRTDRRGTTLGHLQQAARKRGFQAAAVRTDGRFLLRTNPAGIAWVNGDHYVAFVPAQGRDRFTVFDPSRSGERVVSSSELAKWSQGVVLLLAWGGRSLPPVPGAQRSTG